MEPPRNLQVSRGHTFMQIIAGLETTMDPDFVGDNDMVSMYILHLKICNMNVFAYEWKNIYYVYDM